MIYKNQHGWILIDSIVGMTILTIALLALSFSLIQATKATSFNANTTTASYLANQQLNKLRTYEGSGYDRANTNWVIPSTVYTDPQTHVQYTYSTSVLPSASIPTDLDTDVIPVQITVQWSESTGARVLQMATYYYK